MNQALSKRADPHLAAAKKGKQQGGDPSDRGGKFHAGTLVDARFGPSRKWFPGIITRVGGAGTFDVVWDDGDEAKGMMRAMIRLRQPRQ